MSASLNNVATQDGYADQTTLACPGTVRLRFQVANAAVLYRTGIGSPPAFDYVESELLPGFYSLDEVCDAVQVRSLLAGEPARVAIKALTAPEVGSG
jgi:hypothetical protein